MVHINDFFTAGNVCVSKFTEGDKSWVVIAEDSCMGETGALHISVDQWDLFVSNIIEKKPFLKKDI